MSTTAKLRELVRLATDSNWRINQLGAATMADEREITATLENLAKMKEMIPMIESDVKALSSLEP